MTATWIVEPIQGVGIPGNAIARVRALDPAATSVDLWQREAERDVLVHGEPRERGPMDSWRGWTLDMMRPGEGKQRMLGWIERRRPAMRANRAERK